MANIEGLLRQLLGEKEWLFSPRAYLLWYKSPLSPAGPEGKALFFTSSSGLGIPFHFSRWLQRQQQTKRVLLPLTRPVVPSVQPKQPSHTLRLQLFGTGNLILVPHWRHVCDVPGLVLPYMAKGLIV